MGKKGGQPNCGRANPKKQHGAAHIDGKLATLPRETVHRDNRYEGAREAHPSPTHLAAVGEKSCLFDR